MPKFTIKTWKIIQKNAFSDVAEDPTVVTMAIHNFFFIKCSCLRFLGPDEKESPEHQVTPRPQKWSKLAIKRQNNPKKALSDPAGGQIAVILATNYSVFIK